MARFFTTSQYIDMGAITQPSTAITVAAWMYPTNAPSVTYIEMSLISKEFGGSLPFYSYHLTPSTFQPTWNPDFKLGVSGNIYDAQKTNHLFPLNNWYHMAGTWASGDNSRLYINGVQEGISGSAVSGSISYAAFNTFIGRNQLDTKYFLGRIAEACIWDTQLSANEVAALARGRLPYEIQFPNIVRYYPIWGLHSPEIDLSVNHSTGTITGALTQADGPPTTLFSRQHITVTEREIIAAINPALLADRNNPILRRTL